MDDFLESIRAAMGNEPAHIVSAALDHGTWATANKPHVWQRVERSPDGSIDVWLDTAYGCLAVQYEDEGHACFAHGHAIITTPNFVVLNRTIYRELPCYLWRPER